MKTSPNNNIPVRNTKDTFPKKHLAGLRRRAPDGFTQRVMASLPMHRHKTFHWWPEGNSWIAPLLTGVAAALLIVALLPDNMLRSPHTERITVQFELHAPEASVVELVGNFTDWQPGRIKLEGPDQSGHWTASLDLPAGRHEYLFLVDGRRWVTDPLALIYRPDGFGNMNAVVNL